MWGCDVRCEEWCEVWGCDVRCKDVMWGCDVRCKDVMWGCDVMWCVRMWCEDVMWGVMWGVRMWCEVWGCDAKVWGDTWYLGVCWLPPDVAPRRWRQPTPNPSDNHPTIEGSYATISVQLNTTHHRIGVHIDSASWPLHLVWQDAWCRRSWISLDTCTYLHDTFNPFYRHSNGRRHETRQPSRNT